MIGAAAGALARRALVVVWALLHASTVWAQPSGATTAVENGYALLDHASPGITLAAKDLRVALRLRNDGTASWSDEALYRISYWWLDADGQARPDAEPSRRTFLPRVIAPGDVIEIDATLRAPRTPGVYRLRWDVVQEGVGWFSSHDATPVSASRAVVLPSFAHLLIGGPFLMIALMVVVGRVRRRPANPSPIAAPSFTARHGGWLRGWLLLAVALLSVGTAVWVRGDRDKPTVFGDEALYTYKAQNFAHYGGYFAPPGAPDSLHLSAPFYSAVLAPVLWLVPHADAAFPWMLLLNALLHASMIVPAWKIAQAEFPDQRWMIVVATAFWTIPASYSLSIMSEALFVPLFLWTGYAYLRAVQRPHWTRCAWVGVAASAMVLTRFSGVAILGVLALVCVLSVGRGGWRLARVEELVCRAPMVVPPVAAWMAMRWSRAQHEPEPLHSVLSYAAKSVVSLEGRFSVTDFVRVWAGELAYLNLATFNLLAFLGVAMVVGVVGTRGRVTGRAGVASLMPLKGYFLLASLAMLTTATVYMFTHLQTGKPRYAMYGRYADMVVPVIVIFALGVMGPRFRPRWTWRWCLGALGGLALSVVLFAVIPDVGDTRVINMGAAWYRQLQRIHGLSWAWIVLPCACLMWGLLASHAHRWRAVVLTTILVLINVQNTRLVEGAHRFYDAKNTALWSALETVRTDGGRVLYRNLLDVPQLTSCAQYFLYDRVQPYVDGDPIDLDRDHFVYRTGLIPARTYLAAHRTDDLDAGR